MYDICHHPTKSEYQKWPSPILEIDERLMERDQANVMINQFEATIVNDGHINGR
jgi:hypothetical protein